MVVSNIYFVHPYLGKMNPVWRDRMFFRWVGEKPPTRYARWDDHTRLIQFVTPVFCSPLGLVTYSDPAFKGHRWNTSHPKKVTCSMGFSVGAGGGVSVTPWNLRPSLDHVGSSSQVFGSSRCIYRQFITTKTPSSSHPKWNSLIRGNLSR